MQGQTLVRLRPSNLLSPVSRLQAIVVRPNIKEFGETSVVYEDGQEFPCDAVVFATGYTVRMPARPLPV